MNPPLSKLEAWKALLPAKHPKRFVRFLVAWGKTLPRSAKIEDDPAALKAWAKVWDDFPAFHTDGICFHLLEAIKTDPYWSGKRADKEGTFFTMRPDFLLGTSEKWPRWRLVQEGKFKSLGENYKAVIAIKDRMLDQGCVDYLANYNEPWEITTERMLRVLPAGKEKVESNPFLLDEFRARLEERIELRKERDRQKAESLQQTMQQEQQARLQQQEGDREERTVEAAQPETYSESGFAQGPATNADIAALIAEEDDHEAKRNRW